LLFLVVVFFNGQERAFSGWVSIVKELDIVMTRKKHERIKYMSNASFEVNVPRVKMAQHIY